MKAELFNSATRDYVMSTSVSKVKIAKLRELLPKLKDTRDIVSFQSDFTVVERTVNRIAIDTALYTIVVESNRWNASLTYTASGDFGLNDQAIRWKLILAERIHQAFEGSNL